MKKMKSILILLLPILFYIVSCKEDNTMDIADNNPPITNDNTAAAVVSVSVSGNENSYSFSVGIKSPDTGCNQYADWWEVITENETLLYRRILAHSHVNEQPFVRSGGPISITKDQVVIIRAHMNTSGYGDKVFKGSVSTGFKEEDLEKTFANALETVAPLPSGCAF
ncbi:hypothetical protein AWE51_03380 [Aquimarina aggregata]|uniref:DUF4468 domain-containing protein n=2 Tax=Aquimarina aggregata TaxID=1642818 RepID=A0A162DM51_9FLAO|nr:hypothetical protein AWE51_03380 [Aquimarina aggregata]